MFESFWESKTLFVKRVLAAEGALSYSMLENSIRAPRAVAERPMDMVWSRDSGESRSLAIVDVERTVRLEEEQAVLFFLHTVQDVGVGLVRKPL